MSGAPGAPSALLGVPLLVVLAVLLPRTAAARAADAGAEPAGRGNAGSSAGGASGPGAGPRSRADGGPPSSSSSSSGNDDGGPPRAAAADGGAPGARTAADGRAPTLAPALVGGGPAATPAAGAVPPPPAAESVLVTGVVLARGSRDPVLGVSLAVDGLPAGESDEAGRFQLHLSPGRHVVQIQHPGFDLFSAPFEARAGAAPLLLRLEPTRAPGEYETVVRARRPEAPSLTLEKSEITMTPGSLGDPFRVIESLPGVTPVLWPLPVYAVRGSNPGNTGYFLDGLRVPALFHFALGPAVIHPHFLEELTFYPAAYPPAFGRYVGGVVAAQTAAAPADRARGSVDVRLFDAGGMVTSPIRDGQGTVAAAARYAYPAGLLNLLQNEVELHYWDYQARIDHVLGPGRLTLLAFGSYDSLTIPEENDRLGARDDRLVLRFHRFDLRWAGALAGGRLRAALGAGFDRTSSPYDDESEVAVSGRSLLPRLAWQRALGPAVDLVLGADGELTDFSAVSGDLGPDEVLGALRGRTVVLAGSYAGLHVRPGPRWVLNPGLRLDWYRESGSNAVDLQPRLDLRAQATPWLWLEASGGRATQLPSIPLQLPGFEGFGLERHGLQSAWQGSLGAELTLPGALQLDLTGFLQRMRLTDILDPSSGDDPAQADFLVTREALSYGVELMLRRNPRERLNGWLTYTLSKSERAFEGGVVSAADWDQRHVLNLVVGYRWRRYTLGGRFHVHTGRQVRVVDTSPVVYARLPAFYQLDLRLDRRFLFERVTLDLYLELVNSTLTRQVVELRQTPAGVAEEGYSIVLPSLGLRAEF